MQQSSFSCSTSTLACGWILIFICFAARFAVTPAILFVTVVNLIITFNVTLAHAPHMFYYLTGGTSPVGGRHLHGNRARYTRCTGLQGDEAVTCALAAGNVNKLGTVHHVLVTGYNWKNCWVKPAKNLL